jgi:hypothetical protein
MALFVMPAFFVLLPHDIAHALHSGYHQSYEHRDYTQGPKHCSHSHEEQTPESVHHPIQLDIVTYYNDYLQIDLQSHAQAFLTYPVEYSQDIDSSFPADLLPKQCCNLASLQMQNSPPSDRRESSEQNTSIYLSTQRLRI